MVRLKGRKLSRPTLLYKSKLELTRSFWNLDGRELKNPAELPNWACLRIVQDSRSDRSILKEPCKGLLQTFRSHLLSKGIKDPSREPPHGDLEIRDNRDYWKLDNWFTDCLQTYYVTFLIVLLPGRTSSELYNHIKRCGDVKYGIHTVCVKSGKFGTLPYDDNVALVSARTFLF